MNRDSNSYTFGFAAAMVLVVASVLAFTASSLKDLQSENVRKEKMQNILSTIGIQTDREGAEELFNQYIVEQLALKNDGSVDAAVDAFSDVNLAFELKKDPQEQRFPLYVAKVKEMSLGYKPTSHESPILFKSILNNVGFEIGGKNLIKYRTKKQLKIDNTRKNSK